MNFLDILTILDFQSPGNALKIKTKQNYRGVVSLSLPYLVMSMNLNLKHCHLSPWQGGHWPFGIHPSQPGTSPLVIPDVQPSSSPWWESTVGESGILWGQVSTDLANGFWLHSSPCQNFHEPQRWYQTGLEWAWERRRQTHKGWVLLRQLSCADAVGSTEHKRSLSSCLHFLVLQLE